MNDLEKAISLITSKKYKLKDIHEQTGISINNLQSYSSGRVKLENVAWKTVHKLAEYYDKILNVDSPR